MARIIGIDYGIKNCGLAVTDPEQIIVNPLKTVPTKSLMNYLQKYWEEESVEKIVFGYPTHKDGKPTYVVEHINKCVSEIQKKNPDVEIDFQDENYSSVQAMDVMLQSGISKKQRRDKTRLDKLSAVIILQRYLKHI